MAPTPANCADFDLDITVVESAPAIGAPGQTDGGCRAACGSGSCVSSGA